MQRAVIDVFSHATMQYNHHLKTGVLVINKIHPAAKPTVTSCLTNLCLAFIASNDKSPNPLCFKSLVETTTTQQLASRGLYDFLLSQCCFGNIIVASPTWACCLPWLMWSSPTLWASNGWWTSFRLQLSGDYHWMVKRNHLVCPLNCFLQHCTKVDDLALEI
jgi:hypothetical protein